MNVELAFCHYINCIDKQFSNMKRGQWTLKKKQQQLLLCVSVWECVCLCVSVLECVCGGGAYTCPNLLVEVREQLGESRFPFSTIHCQDGHLAFL